MKFKSYGWLLLALSGVMQAGVDSDKLIVSFAQNGAILCAQHEGYSNSLPNERNLRKQLYWLDQHNPRYYLLDSIQDDFDYYIAIVTDHIALLENKILQNKSRFKSTGIVRGIGFSALSALCGAGAYYSYTIPKNDNYWGVVSQDAVNSSVGLGIMTAMFTYVAGMQFYKIYHHVERLKGRLERDKRILDVLKQAKAAKQLKDMMKAAK